MSNVHSTFTRLFDNIGFKCKIICHFKISAKVGIQPRIKYGVSLPPTRAFEGRFQQGTNINWIPAPRSGRGQVSQE